MGDMSVPVPGLLGRVLQAQGAAWWGSSSPTSRPVLRDPAASQVLSDEHAREMCLRFADMECKLGEIDRARAIYSFCSQICDPRVGMFLGKWVGGKRLPLGGPAHTQTPPPSTDNGGLLANVEGL